jgi:hypothetical protein
MKKSKILAVGLIGVLLLVGLALASCSNCAEKGECKIGSNEETECGMDSCAVMKEYNRVQQKNTATIEAWKAAGGEQPNGPTLGEGEYALINANDTKCDCN